MGTCAVATIAGMETYSIGQLARKVGVPTSTVRFYERVGLLKPDFRTGGNYRGYTAGTMDRLRFVRSAQATGLSLADIEALLELTHSTSAPTKAPCDEVLSLMQNRLTEMRLRIRDLRQVERVLARSLDHCCKGNPEDLCTEVCRLGGTNSTGCKPPSKKKRRSA
jgi:DNA-binding transcriptional MerR regulator